MSPHSLVMIHVYPSDQLACEAEVDGERRDFKLGNSLSTQLSYAGHVTPSTMKKIIQSLRAKPRSPTKSAAVETSLPACIAKTMDGTMILVGDYIDAQHVPKIVKDLDRWGIEDLLPSCKTSFYHLNQCRIFQGRRDSFFVI